MLIVFIRYALTLAVLVNVWLTASVAVFIAILLFFIFSEITGHTIARLTYEISRLNTQATRMLEMLNEREQERRR